MTSEAPSSLGMSLGACRNRAAAHHFASNARYLSTYCRLLVHLLSLAQLVEQLTVDQWVTSSNLVGEMFLSCRSLFLIDSSPFVCTPLQEMQTPLAETHGAKDRAATNKTRRFNKAVLRRKVAEWSSEGELRMPGRSAG